MITIFDVCNKMKEGSIGLFYNMVGGKQVGKGKNKNAIIEVLVDNETFQNFAFQKSYGHAKSSRSEKILILIQLDKDEYDKQHELLKKLNSEPNDKRIVESKDASSNDGDKQKTANQESN